MFGDEEFWEERDRLRAESRVDFWPDNMLPRPRPRWYEFLKYDHPDSVGPSEEKIETEIQEEKTPSRLKRMFQKIFSLFK